jgi:hypothetical protein
LTVGVTIEYPIERGHHGREDQQSKPANV